MMSSVQHHKSSKLTKLGLGGVASIAKGALTFLGAVAIYLVIEFDSESYFSRFENPVRLTIPSGLDLKTRRALSQNLGGGNCKWQPPTYDVPSSIDFYKTAIVGFPSGDKRMIFIQMEALTGWPAKDEWDFVHVGDSNHPFIKANYPHHEGIWGWGTNADQIVMMVRNIKKSMIEYHDILWDIGYAKTWEEASANLDKLYSEPPPASDFYAWRDLRVMDEIQWYGWFIDYWMEQGLMRDIFTHKITTAEHWNMLMMPTVYTRAELEYGLIVGNDTVVTPSYDPHCLTDVSGGCRPVAIISAEKLRDHNEGPAETVAIANALVNNAKMSEYVIASEAWNCIWQELIPRGKGLRTVADRPKGGGEYTFSAEMLGSMVVELTRLIDKYGSTEWNSLATSNRIVELLTEHRALIQTELDDVNSGVRKLTTEDFLGPKERHARRKAQALANHEAKKEPNLKYFDDLERKYAAKKRQKAKLDQLREARTA